MTLGTGPHSSSFHLYHGTTFNPMFNPTSIMFNMTKPSESNLIYRKSSFSAACSVIERCPQDLVWGGHKSHTQNKQHKMNTMNINTCDTYIHTVIYLTVSSVQCSDCLTGCRCPLASLAAKLDSLPVGERADTDEAVTSGLNGLEVVSTCKLTADARESTELARSTDDADVVLSHIAFCSQRYTNKFNTLASQLHGDKDKTFSTSAVNTRHNVCFQQTSAVCFPKSIKQ